MNENESLAPNKSIFLVTDEKGFTVLHKAAYNIAKITILLKAPINEKT